MEINNNSVYILWVTRKDNEVSGDKEYLITYIAGVFLTPELAYTHLGEIKEKYTLFSSYVREIRVNYPEKLITQIHDQEEKKNV